MTLQSAGSCSVEASAIPQASETAVQHHQAGRLAEAEAIYRGILAAEPRHFHALHLLGVIAHQRGDHRQAVELINRALEQDASAFHAFGNLGMAHLALGDLDQAQTCFQRAISLKPDYVEAHRGLAALLQAQGKLADASEQLRAVVSLRPDLAEGHCALGNVLLEQGKYDDAAACYQSALSLDPDSAGTHFNLAKVFDAQGRAGEALAGYQQAVLLDPELAEAHYALGVKLQSHGLIEDTLDCFRTALSLRPEFVEARWALAISQLPLVFGDGDVPEDSRARFSEALADLEQWFDADRVREGYKAVGTMQPFYLAYHLRNNRDLLSRYGDLCARLMRHWQDRQGLALHPPARGDTIRVGIVSAHVHDQPVWTAITKGWCRHLDRRRFATHVLSLGAREDQETAFAESSATSLVRGPKGLRQWVDAILAQELDVIIYPEIGMDPMTASLASLRLSPVQVAAWGHPETTGLPTIDYYLSAEDFEPAGAQANYRERLIALPHLGCCYQALGVTPADPELEPLGIAPDVPLLLCPGTPFKYAPQHDAVLVEIARRLGRCQLVFFNHQLENLSESLRQRLDAAFARSGMYFDEYAVFIPWLARPLFYGLLQRADVYLDTIGFSGFNTTMQAIECGLPIVAKEGRFMRGRLASGILKRIGMRELVAESDEAYVDLAVRLAQDAGTRQSVRERIEASRPVLFDDVAPVRALEEFLVGVTRPGER